MQRVVIVVVLLCVGQWALGQEFYCSTSAGQAAYQRLLSATIPYSACEWARNLLLLKLNS